VNATASPSASPSIRSSGFTTGFISLAMNQNSSRVTGTNPQLRLQAELYTFQMRSTSTQYSRMRMGRSVKRTPLPAARAMRSIFSR